MAKDILIHLAGTGYAVDSGANAISYVGGATYNVHSLITGGMLAFDATGAVIDKTNPVISGDYIHFAQGRAVNGSKISQPIERANVEVTKTAYSAPVAKIMSVGYDGTNSGTGDLDANYFTSLLAEGDELGVIVIDMEKDQYDIKREKIYSITATTVEASLANPGETVLARIVALINGDTEWNVDSDGNALVTAAIISTDKGLKFTGRAGKQFRVVGFGIIETAVVCESAIAAGSGGWINGTYYDASTTPTLASKLVTGATFNTTNVYPLSIGVGTSDQVLALEKECATKDGNTDRFSLKQPWSVPSSVVDGETYVTYAITWKHIRNAGSVQSQLAGNILYLAIPDGDDMVTYMDNIIAAL